MNYTKILFSAALIFNIYIIEAQSIVIKNAMIFDGINDNAFTGNILIEDGVIKKVSKSSIQGDTIIDAEGKIVTPGFIVSNTDIGIVEIGALSVTKDDQSSIYSIGFSIHDAFNPNSTRIPWNRSNGITSAITLPRDTSSPIGGLGSFFTLNGSLQIDSLPDMAMIGRIGGSSSSSRSEMLALTDDILSFASSLDSKDMKSNADINQIINDSPLADYLELQSRDVKALFRLIDDKLPLIIKANRATDILKLLEMKKKYNLNLIIMGAQEASLVAKQISSSNTPLIINPINNIPGSFDELASNINLSSRLEAEGIKLIFSSGGGQNSHLVRQGAGIAVANGMSYGGAIRALTSNVADSFNIASRGLIKPGNIADLVIWEADPLEPSSMPEKVFINGVDMDLTTRSTRLRDRYIKNLDKPNTYRD
ncbi:MAG: amidohydrolase family protein [Gammaproteobacteria bacterium]|jgi:imidazolonepropionase-like amidohydrolase|tara:strand:- start:41 stop:1309 length:1269 start_codon:yes stop_codon:yes gene_type:complete